MFPCVHVYISCMYRDAFRTYLLALFYIHVDAVGIALWTRKMISQFSHAVNIANEFVKLHFWKDDYWEWNTPAPAFPSSAAWKVYKWKLAKTELKKKYILHLYYPFPQWGSDI